jgi:hypothetical protein
MSFLPSLPKNSMNVFSKLQINRCIWSMNFHCLTVITSSKRRWSDARETRFWQWFATSPNAGRLRKRSERARAAFVWHSRRPVGVEVGRADLIGLVRMIWGFSGSNRTTARRRSKAVEFIHGRSRPSPAESQRGGRGGRGVLR